MEVVTDLFFHIVTFKWIIKEENFLDRTWFYPWVVDWLDLSVTTFGADLISSQSW